MPRTPAAQPGCSSLGRVKPSSPRAATNLILSSQLMLSSGPFNTSWETGAGSPIWARPLVRSGVLTRLANTLQVLKRLLLAAPERTSFLAVGEAVVEAAVKEGV